MNAFKLAPSPPIPKGPPPPPKRRFIVTVPPAMIAKRNGDIIRVEPGLWAIHCPGGCVTLVRAKTSNAAAHAATQHAAGYAFKIGRGYTCKWHRGRGRREIKS